MSSYEIVQPAGPRRRFWNPAAPSEEAAALDERSELAIETSANALLELQQKEGCWIGDLTADISLESDYILLQLWLYQPEGATWQPPSRDRIDRSCRSILAKQLPSGGFNIYPGGPDNINATVKAYVALRLAGYHREEPALVKARGIILQLGGLQACNSYTKINLSLFDLYPRRYVPTVPPEIVLVPGNVLYEMSSWTRAIVVPLSIVQALGQRKAPDGFDVNELLNPDGRYNIAQGEGVAVLFRHLDKVVKLWHRRGPKNVRAAALREAEHWMLDRTRYSEGLGAIYPSMMYLVMALGALGYEDDHPDLLEAISQFDNLLTETNSRFFFQPCFSPVWDTAIAMFALGEMGQGETPALTRATDWILSKEIRRKGDWSVKRPVLTPSGWPFEFANEFYPDIDDTAMVLLGLLRTTASDQGARDRAVHRAINWLIGMQSSDGGWAAFDVDNDWWILNKLPFADHNAMLDPTCPDISGRVLEALCRHGVPGDHPAVENGVRYLLGCQESDGSWYGRWGVNYVYGTFLALRGLRAAKAQKAAPAIRKAASWLKSVQNSDGGWGESCASYEANCFISAHSTPSQTAWGLLGLFAAGESSSPAVRHGVNWLLDRQKADGTWDEDLATGTGFPNVFFLSYHLYRHYFPLIALHQWRLQTERTT